MANRESNDRNVRQSLNYCYVCRFGETKEKFCANVCDCVGKLSRIHYSCLIDTIISHNDIICRFCRQQYSEPRIEPIICSDPTFSEYIRRPDVKRFAINAIKSFILVYLIIVLIQHNRYSNCHKSLIKAVLIAFVWFVTACLTFLFIHTIVTFLTTQKKRIRWLRIEDSRDGTLFIHYLDLRVEFDNSH